ncbi:sex peptide receptor-related protein 2-like [Haliotis cracherodii]|uniref:sex peptide receptor-related protein 2-like n=1 Tax=Haliotis cracherodii TaxID=6455 RepID=UPI0039ECF2ED
MAVPAAYICCFTLLLGTGGVRAGQALTTSDYGAQGGLNTSSPDTDSGSRSVNCSVDPDVLGGNIDWMMCDTVDIHPDFNDTDGEAKTGSCNEGTKKNCEVPKPPLISIISQGMLSKEQYQRGETVCLYLFYPLFTSAVLLNTFNLMVYTDPAMRSPTSTYLIALATDELLFAVICFVWRILRQVYGIDAIKKQAYLYFALFGLNFSLASIRVLMYCITVLVSTERFLAVAFPLKSRNFRLIKSPIIFMISLTIICLFCHLPASFKYDVVPKPNSTDYTIKPSAMFTNNRDLFLGLAMTNKILYTYIVLAGGLIMNLCVLLALRMHSRKRQNMNTTVDAEKAAKRERQTTITILTSTFLFTFLALPLVTDSIVSTFVPDYQVNQREHYINMMMKDVNNVLIMFSLSTDFVFYITLSRAYRRTFYRRLPFMATICRRQK